MSYFLKFIIEAKKHDIMLIVRRQSIYRINPQITCKICKIVYNRNIKQKSNKIQKIEKT